ncbi:MAG: phytoene/squalene synthase family protein [Bryobacteraceae bacterium]|nr:phytoene/squalene synthase family protein [Bryobacteraceae bacterium]
MTTIGDSYEHCVAVARARAKNFYWSFVLLPREKRRAMCAVYAFMRECDDLSDGPRASAEAMAAWRADLDRTLGGDPAVHPIWPALHDAVERFRIPHHYLHEMIDGVQSDLAAHVFETFDELYRYCYLVASVVGLTIIHIFEFDDPSAPALAERCGIAFQLTNIIRDAGEDQSMGRVYLPQDDLRRFGVTRLDQDSPELRRLLAHYGERARAYYDESRPLVRMMHSDSRASLWALIEIYSRLLRRIEKSGYDVLSRRIRLSNWEKARILIESRFRA